MPYVCSVKASINVYLKGRPYTYMYIQSITINYLNLKYENEINNFYLIDIHTCVGVYICTCHT